MPACRSTESRTWRVHLQCPFLLDVLAGDGSLQSGSLGCLCVSHHTSRFSDIQAWCDHKLDATEMRQVPTCWNVRLAPVVHARGTAACAATLAFLVPTARLALLIFMVAMVNVVLLYRDRSKREVQ